jgi:hypothetical protein
VQLIGQAAVHARRLGRQSTGISTGGERGPGDGGSLQSGSSKTASSAGTISTLSQKLEEIEDAATRQVFLDAVAHGSVISWQHINLLGEYDFSDEKLQDNVGIRPPKLTP